MSVSSVDRERTDRALSRIEERSARIHELRRLREEQSETATRTTAGVIEPDEAAIASHTLSTAKSELSEATASGMTGEAARDPAGTMVNNHVISAPDSASVSAPAPAPVSAQASTRVSGKAEPQKQGWKEFTQVCLTHVYTHVYAHVYGIPVHLSIYMSTHKEFTQGLSESLNKAGATVTDKTSAGRASPGSAVVAQYRSPYSSPVP